MSDTPAHQTTGAQPAAWVHVATLRGLAKRQGVDDISAYALAEAAKVIEEYDAEAKRLRAALRHILDGALSLPRFAEAEARAALGEPANAE